MIDVGSSTLSHDEDNDGTLSDDEIVTTNAPSTITSDSYFETDEEVTVDNQTFLKEGDVNPIRFNMICQHLGEFDLFQIVLADLLKQSRQRWVVAFRGGI